MPRKYRKKKLYRKRKMFRGRKKYFRKKNFKISGIPWKSYYKLNYSENIPITTGVMNFYNWRLNSVYDPNFTGTGGQPLWHDQLAAIYTSYKVNGCKFKIMATNLGTQPVRMCVFPTAITYSS